MIVIKDLFIEIIFLRMFFAYINFSFPGFKNLAISINRSLFCSFCFCPNFLIRNFFRHTPYVLLVINRINYISIFIFLLIQKITMVPHPGKAAHKLVC